MMENYPRLRLIAFAIMFGVFGLPGLANALDAPHDLLNCDDCHALHSPGYPALLGNLCTSCHFNGGPAPAVVTHSSLTTDNGYGNWDLDCWACHDPHTQEQDRFWGTSYGKFVRRILGQTYDVKEIDPGAPGPYYPQLSVFRDIFSKTIEFTDNKKFIDDPDGDEATCTDITNSPACQDDTATAGGTYTGPPTGIYTLEVTTGGTSGNAELTCTTSIAGDACNPSTTYTWTDNTAIPIGSNGVTINITDTGGPAELLLGEKWTSPSVADDICQVCHESTTNYNNLTAINTHNDYGTDTQPGGTCTSCHNHADGFMPAGGGCLGCHDKTQPNVDGVPSPPTDDYRRQVVAAGGDFERTSHHVTDGTTTEIVTQDDCLVCHDQGNHMNNTDPQVWLKHPDTGAQITYDGTGSSVEGFCTGCHDSDGSVISGTTPFFAGAGDTNTPPNIAANWSSSSHATTSVNELANDKCMACHGGADATRTTVFEPGLVTDRDIHGGSNASMLSDLVAGTSTTINGTEDLCFVCHDSDGPSSFDVSSRFNPSPVYSGTGDGGAPIDQVHDLSAMNSCSSCHNPHMANSTNRNIDPDTPTSPYTAVYDVSNTYGGQSYDSGGNFDPVNPAGFQGAGYTIESAVADGGNTGNDTATSGGTYTGGSVDDYTVTISTGGQPPTAEITVTSTGGDNSGPTSVSAFDTPVAVGSNGVTIAFTEGGGTPSSVGPAVPNGGNGGDDTATSGGTFTGGSDDTYTVTVSTGGTVGAGGATVTDVCTGTSPSGATCIDDTLTSSGSFTGTVPETYTLAVTRAGDCSGNPNNNGQVTLTCQDDTGGDCGATLTCSGTAVPQFQLGSWGLFADIAVGGDALAVGETWEVQVTAGGSNPQITVTSTQGDNSGPTDVSSFGTPYAVGTNGITISFTDGGDGNLTLNDSWTIAATAATPGDGLTSGDIWTIAVTGSCWPNCVETDYVAFCLACHDGTTPPGVTMPGTMVEIASNYLASNGADQHGNGDGSTGSTTSKGPLKRPWTDVDGNDPSQNYAAIPCTTCHDQHGSPNIFHLKESINVAGQQLITGSTSSTVFDPADTTNNRPEANGSTTYTLPEVGGSQNLLNWGAWCTFCHTMGNHTGVTEQTTCNSAHVHGGNNF